MFLKILSGRAENVTVQVDLFPDDRETGPRPAWRVIEAARRQFLTGELLLDTTPPARVYLRDGRVYFAERSTDGGLGVRLLVEGVITRAQMSAGTLLVGGVEHLGRMFERDATIERDSVELCVELMADDVLTHLAEEPVGRYKMTMYKRHPSGIDRWWRDRVEVITHVIEGSHLAPDDAASAGRQIRRHKQGTGDAARVALAATEPTIEMPAVIVATEPEPEPVVVHAVAVAEPEPVVVHAVAVAEPEPAVVIVASEAEPAVTHAAADPEPPQIAPAEVPAAAVEPIEAPVAAAPEPTPTVVESAGSLPPSGVFDARPADALNTSEVEALMTSTIADEVAEAVRRALAAIDASHPPATAAAPTDFVPKASASAA